MGDNFEKICPYCGENIRAEAIKCKHCKSYLTSDLPKKPIFQSELPHVPDQKWTDTPTEKNFKSEVSRPGINHTFSDANVRSTETKFYESIDLNLFGLITACVMALCLFSIKAPIDYFVFNNALTFFDLTLVFLLPFFLIGFLFSFGKTFLDKLSSVTLMQLGWGLIIAGLSLNILWGLVYIFQEWFGGYDLYYSAMTIISTLSTFLGVGVLITVIEKKGKPSNRKTVFFALGTGLVLSFIVSALFSSNNNPVAFTVVSTFVISLWWMLAWVNQNHQVSVPVQPPLISNKTLFWLIFLTRFINFGTLIPYWFLRMFINI